MPRPKQGGSPSYSPGQAHYVLNRLINERRLSHGEVSRYVGEMHNEIGDLERRLASLRAAAGHTGSSSASSSGGTTAAPAAGRRRGRPPGSRNKAAAGAGSSAAAAAPAARGRKRGRKPGSGAGAGASAGGGGRKRSALSPEQLASRQLQGRYLGLIRQIPASKRAQYQKTAKEKGREAAIKDMQSDLKK